MGEVGLWNLGPHVNENEKKNRKNWKSKILKIKEKNGQKKKKERKKNKNGDMADRGSFVQNLAWIHSSVSEKPESGRQ